ncbi:MAG TPA: metal ABC transporter substrate-binding protein [Oscillospiraceae bacterium]|nr:metal ABC transporter substrate-binding protein [Oscillospiraceae bacterium]HXK77646.1 metal ABC transporter substrate-binding protein [Oscillospiraceae bacterium]
MKRFLSIILSLLMAVSLSACTKSEEAESSSVPDSSEVEETEEKISIVCTNFSEYDFVRQIVGEAADLTMLLKPGAESHSYEPTPQDMITIENCDLFVYVGGDSDEWVSGILESVDQSGMETVKLMDCVETVEEEHVEGMQAEEDEQDESESDEEEPELDEHVWTSPANAMLIVQKLSDTICEIDPENQETYEQNTTAYLGDLQALDDEFREVIDSAARKEIIVGDRFPFLYFCKEFGLTYYAAFPGCSTDTEADAATIAFLINKVKEDNIPVVFHIELSNEQMCDSICEATGAKKELLNAVHNVSADDFAAGATYLSLMEHNVEVLREALN